MGAVVAVIADVVFSAAVSYAASKVVTKVALKLGVNDKAASILGSVAGLGAGAYTFSTGAASEFVSGVANNPNIVNPLIASPTTSGTEVKEVAGASGTDLDMMTGGEIASTSSNATSGLDAPLAPIEPVKTAGSGATGDTKDIVDKADNSSWWDSDATKTMTAGTVGGLAQGYMVGEQMADAQKEIIAKEERDKAENEKRIQDWTNFNRSTLQPETVTDAVRLQNPLDTVQAPTTTAPRAGMLTR